MDRERRHHLAQNSLSNWLYTQYEDVFKPNSQLISWLFVAFLVLVCGFFLTRFLLQTSSAKSWQQYFTALYSPDPEASFQLLVEDRSSAKGPAAAQIRLTYAQILLSGSQRLLAADKAKAVEQLEKSVPMFQAAQKLADNDGIRQSAVYGSAVAYETLAACRTAGNDLAEAEKAYQELVNRWPDSLYGQRAAKRLVQLAKPETREFYHFIANAPPITVVPAAPPVNPLVPGINKEDIGEPARELDLDSRFGTLPSPSVIPQEPTGGDQTNEAPPE